MYKGSLYLQQKLNIYYDSIDSLTLLILIIYFKVLIYSILL